MQAAGIHRVPWGRGGLGRVAARAQQSERMRRIGVLHAGSHGRSGILRPASRRSSRSLQQSGWTIGRNVRIDTRWAASDTDRIRKYAADWWRSRRTSSWPMAPPTVRRLLQATRTVPIVFPVVADPVGAGFVESLARPGGNVTGFMHLEYSMSGKWLELLKEIAPGVTRVAVLRDAASAAGTASSPSSSPWRRRSEWR